MHEVCFPGAEHSPKYVAHTANSLYLVPTTDLENISVLETTMPSLRSFASPDQVLRGSTRA